MVTEKKNKMYVVVEGCWETNDEYYFRAGARHGNEEGIGTPKKVFLSKADAKAMATALNIKEVKGVCLSHFSEEPQSLILDKKKNKLVKILGLQGKPYEELEYDDFQIPEDISDETAARLLDCITITWYDVVEVDA